VRGLAPVLALLGAVALAACGGSSGSSSSPGGKLTVFAAASLTRALTGLEANRYEFGGSNTLELQIEQGAPADVFLSASPTYTSRLAAKGLVDGAVTPFATNELVLVVPRGNPAHIQSVADLTRKGVKLVLGAAGVPAGDYARDALSALHLRAALQNVVSDEPDVEGVVAKVATGEADAGFVYRSDARAVAAQVREVPLPPAGRRLAVYDAVVVKGSHDPAAARAYVRSLLSGAGLAALERAGFTPPPVHEGGS
jgi:molybdate transport system substrate-binding protein